jgi:hypothetical protein
MRRHPVDIAREYVGLSAIAGNAVRAVGMGNRIQQAEQMVCPLAVFETC